MAPNRITVRGKGRFPTQVSLVPDLGICLRRLADVSKRVWMDWGVERLPEVHAFITLTKNNVRKGSSNRIRI